MKKQLDAGVSEQLADIQNFSDSTLAPGFGGAVDTVASSANQNIVHQNIIKRFNQHSIMVMETADAAERSDELVEPGLTSQPGQVREERKRLREAGVLEDLAEPAAKKPAHLQLSRLERYLTGPTPAASRGLLSRRRSTDGLIKGIHKFYQRRRRWTPCLIFLLEAPEWLAAGKTSWQRIVLCQFKQTSANSILQCVS